MFNKCVLYVCMCQCPCVCVHIVDVSGRVHTHIPRWLCVHCACVQFYSHTRCNIIKKREKSNTHSTLHCNIVQHTVTHCNTLQHNAPRGVATVSVTHFNTLQHTATHCNTLQHTATHCNTLQHAKQKSKGVPLPPLKLTSSPQ